MNPRPLFHKRHRMTRYDLRSFLIAAIFSLMIIHSDIYFIRDRLEVVYLAVVMWLWVDQAIRSSCEVTRDYTLSQAGRAVSYLYAVATYYLADLMMGSVAWKALFITGFFLMAKFINDRRRLTTSPMGQSGLLGRFWTSRWFVPLVVSAAVATVILADMHYLSMYDNYWFTDALG